MKWFGRREGSFVLFLTFCILLFPFPAVSFPANPVLTDSFNDWSNAGEKNFSSGIPVASEVFPICFEPADLEIVKKFNIIQGGEMLEESAVLPDTADLLKYMPPVSSQLYQDCTTFALAYYCTSYWNFRSRGLSPGKDNRYLGSSLYLFNQCNGGSNVPISFATPYYLTQLNGCSSLSTFSPGNYSSLPGIEIQIQSLQQRTSDLEYIYISRNYAGKEQYDPGGEPLSLSDIHNIKYYLSKDIPVIASIYIYPSFFDASSLSSASVYYGPSKPYPEPSSIHSITIAGYIDDPEAPGGGFFYLRNSWGSGWGSAGDCWVTYDFMKEHSIEAYPVKGLQIYSPAFFLVLQVEHLHRGDLKVEVLVDGENIHTYSPYDMDVGDSRENLDLVIDLTDHITNRTDVIDLKVSDMSKDKTGIIREALLVHILSDVHMSASDTDPPKMVAVEFEIENPEISDEGSVRGTIILDEVEFVEVEPIPEPDQVQVNNGGGSGGGCNVTARTIFMVFLLIPAFILYHKR